jgi:hypothetical protein
MVGGEVFSLSVLIFCAHPPCSSACGYSTTLPMWRQTDLTTLPVLRYHTLTMKRSESSPTDLAPYAGRWVALAQGRVVGVGWTAEEARRAAKRSRPKEEPQVIFVTATGVPDDNNPLA